MKPARDKLTKELPNSCAVHAAALSWLTLRQCGAPARMLLAIYDDGIGHVCTFFAAPNDRCFVYDEQGSRYVRGVSMDTPPLAIARKAFGAEVRSASWILGPAQRNGKDRRLSPAECRNHLPSLARLLEQDAAPVHARRMSPREARGRSLFTI